MVNKKSAYVIYEWPPSYRLIDYNPTMASTPQPSSYTYGGQAMKNTPSSHDTSGSKEELYDREKQLAMQETRLREYQERVLRYERLAEDATRVALQEKELRLNKLAEELKQREIQARNKLATAVESLELLKNQPPMAASPWPPNMPRNSKMNLEHRNQSSVSDAITTDDDEDELPASEVNAPTSRKSAKFILPEVEDKSPEIEDVQEDISVDVTVHEEKPDDDAAGATGTASGGTVWPSNDVPAVNCPETPWKK